MIEGKLVDLRALEMTDLERVTRWMNDRDVTRYLQQRYAQSLAAEEAWLRDRTSKPVSYANASFAIDTKDGTHIGGCGMHTGAPENRNAFVGIYIGEATYRGRGYGTDALQVLMRFGFEEMNLNRISLDVYAFNERAIASYVKCGFVEEGRLRDAHYADGVYSDVVAMSVLRDEWTARQ